MAAPSKKVFMILIIAVVCLSDVCVLNVKGAGSLVTTPAAIGGVLTSCDETRLTCIHDNVAGENTRWRIGTAMDSSSVCQETIDHTRPATPYSCDEFSFEEITALPGIGNVSDLNSTAIVNPLSLDLSGSQMECVAGSLSSSPLVGSVTFCVIDQLSRPMNVRSVLLPNNLTSIVLEWDTFSQPTCSRDPVSYTIAIDGVTVPPDNITVLSNASYIVSGLEANRMYTASVRTVISNCVSDQTNLTFQVIAQTPTPVVDARFFCANSSDSITLALSLMFPSNGSSSGVVYPPTRELSVTVSVSDSSGLFSNTTYPVSQSDAFFNLRNNESYTISVIASHDTTGPSTPNITTLTTFIFLVDTNTTAEDDRVTVRLNDCIENPTMFTSTLLYGSCRNSVTFQENRTFSSSSEAVFVLNLSSVTGNLCIRVEVTHQSQPNRPLNTLERQLNFSSCPVAPINSLAGSRVSIQFSSSESSGTVDHGTDAMFVSSSNAYTLDGPSQSTCRNGMWTDLVERRTNLAGWVIAVIVVVILLVAAGIGGGVTGYLIWHFCCSHREKSGGTIELNEKEKLEADGNHELTPTGDEYAVVDKSSKRKPAASENQALYQDPTSIQHETAPTGDVYAVTEKKQKKKGPTEAELAQMYSIPDKTKGGGLNYASLDMPTGGGSEAKRPAQTEYASVIN